MGTAIVSQELQEFQFANFLRNSTLIFRKIKIIIKKKYKTKYYLALFAQKLEKGIFFQKLGC